MNLLVVIGRNHDMAYTGVIMEGASGFPGYDSVMGKDTARVMDCEIQGQVQVKLGQGPRATEQALALQTRD